jgi:hypothetical protein
MARSSATRSDIIRKQSAQALRRLSERYGNVLDGKTLDHGRTRVAERAAELGYHIKQRPLTTFAIVAASALALGTLATFARHNRPRHGLQRLTRHGK